MRKKILVADNQDSFVYNLISLLREHADVYCDIRLPGELSGCSAADYDGLLLSPGPGVPEDFPQMLRLLAEADRLPVSEAPAVLGVCLGHQAICHYYGGRICRLPAPAHGHRSLLRYAEPRGAIQPPAGGEELHVGRYHSWAADERGMPGCLRVTSRAADDGAVMSVEHCGRPLYGVQFHPESIMSDRGAEYLSRWINLIRPAHR